MKASYGGARARLARRAALVLVADDCDDLRVLYTRQLERVGLRTVSAGNGAEVVERAVATRPDVIVLDLQMPELDGLEALRRLKSDPRTARAPVIVLTGSGMEARRAAAEAGCVAYLLKPCPAAALAAAVTSFAEASGPTLA